MARRTKKASPIPVGKWVKANKVKLNKNGTVDAIVPQSSLKKTAKNPKRKKNVAAGFFDEDGYFHPIRASYDYKPGRVGEKSKAKKKKATKKRK